MLLLQATEGPVLAGFRGPPPTARHQALQLHLHRLHTHIHEQLHSQGHLHVNKPKIYQQHKLTEAKPADASTRSPAAALTTLLDTHDSGVAAAAEVYFANASSHLLMLPAYASCSISAFQFIHSCTTALAQLHTCMLA
jgi:hypothetical protein